MSRGRAILNIESKPGVETQMQTEKLKLLLEQVQTGQMNVDSALAELRNLPYENLDGIATLDHHRALRNGFPEVVFGQGKSYRLHPNMRTVCGCPGKMVLVWQKFMQQFRSLMWSNNL